jgi:HD superfamily phosphohydrolase
MALTKDKKQTLCALFHDLGTPAFSHVVDFMFNDPTNQASSEKKYQLLFKTQMK